MQKKHSTLKTIALSAMIPVASIALSVFALVNHL